MKYSFYAPTPITKGFILNKEHSFFSIVVPEESTNYVYNPEVKTLAGYSILATTGSMTLDNTKQHYGENSLNCILDNGELVACDVLPVLTPGIPYTASVSIKGAGQVQLYIADDNYLPIGEIKTINAKGFWKRYNITAILNTSIPNPKIVVRVVTQFAGNLDAFQLEQKPYATTFISGNLSGLIPNTNEPLYFWLGIPNASPSIRTAAARDGGKIVPLHEFGFDVTGYEGFGLPAFTPSSTPLSLQIGSQYYCSTLSERSIEICGVLIKNDIKDFLCSKGVLSNRLKPTDNKPLKLLYQLYECNEQICQTLEANVVYKSGLEGNVQNLLGEEICLSFDMFDPYFYPQGNRSVDIPIRKREATVGPSPLEKSVLGVWDYMDFPNVVGNPRKVALGPDNNLYAGLQNVVPASNEDVVYQWDGTNWNVVGSVNPADATGNVFALHKGEGTLLFVGGNFLTMGNSNGTITSASFGAVPGGFTTASLGIAMYDTSTDIWYTVGRLLSTNATVPRCLGIELLPDGDVAFVGNFEAIEDRYNNVIANTQFFAIYSPANDTWSSGSGSFNGLPNTQYIEAVKAVKYTPNLQSRQSLLENNIWLGGSYFIANGSPDLNNLENITRYNRSMNVLFQPGTSDGVNGNLVDGVVRTIEICETTGRIFAGGNFLGSQYFATTYGGMGYPPDIIGEYTSPYNLQSGQISRPPGSWQANFTIAELYNQGVFEQWRGLGMIGIVNPDVGVSEYGHVYDMKIDRHGRLHVVGDFNYASVEFDNYYIAYETDTIVDGLDAQQPNLNSYAIWENDKHYDSLSINESFYYDEARWIKPDIFMDYTSIIINDYYPVGFASIELGTVLGMDFTGAGIISDLNVQTLPTASASTIPPQYLSQVFLGVSNLGTPDGIFSAYDVQIIDTSCSDFIRPTLEFIGPGQLQEIINLTTNSKISFVDLVLVEDEVAVLDLSQPIIRFKSTSRGDLRSYLNTQSSISNFNLVTGINVLQVKFDLSAFTLDIRTRIEFKERYLSTDLACNCEC